MLRAIRFAAQLDFAIAPETFAAVQKLAEKIRLVSAERVREELIKLFAPPHAARGLTLLHESGLMPHVLPELVPTLTCDQSPDYHPEGTVFNHIRLMLAQLPCPLPDESLPWAVLLHDIAKPQTAAPAPDGTIHFYTHEKVGAQMAEEILQRLKFPRQQTDNVVAAVLHHMQFKDAPHMRKATLRRMLMRPTFLLELELHRLDCLGSHRRLDLYDFVREQQQHLNDRPHLVPPLLTGGDLIQLGVKPGPAMGALLTELRDLQLGEELTTAVEARGWVEKRLSGMTNDE